MATHSARWLPTLFWQNYQGERTSSRPRVVVAAAFRQASGLAITPNGFDSIAPEDRLEVTFTDGQRVIAPGGAE